MTKYRQKNISRIMAYHIAAAGMIALSGCAGRPSPDVLNPVRAETAATQRVTVLAATNRDRGGAGKAFGDTWSGHLSYEEYQFSVPKNRKDASIKYPSGKPDASRQFLVTDRKPLTRDAFVQTATRTLGPDGTIGIFVHGYNNSHQEALFRMAQMGADAKAPMAPILFSWPSAAAVTGYVMDRDAALYSRTELDQLIISLAATGKAKKVLLFGHSMGGFLAMETVRQLKLQHRDDIVGKLVVVLAAPDIDVDVFRSQLRDIGKMPTPITILVSKDDRALSASSFIGGERQRVGRLDIEDPVIQDAAAKENLRLIDITSVQGDDPLGHNRYAALAQFGQQFITEDGRRKANIQNVGAFVFDAAGAVVASPFRLAGRIVTTQ